MKIKFLVLFFFAACLFVSSGCGGNGGDDNSKRVYNGNIAVDTDNDGVADTLDCAPADSTRYNWVPFWPDEDGDGLPDSGTNELYCVGLPATYLAGYTPNAPPPLDPCPDDPDNICGNTTVPYLQIDFAFASGTPDWTVYGTCFPDPAAPDNFPEMCEGVSHEGSCVGEVNPEAITSGYCIFSINFEPPVANRCGDEVYWLPCQSADQVLFSGLDGDGLGGLQVYLSPSGLGNDILVLDWDVIDNGQDGANFIVFLNSGNNQSGDDVTVIVGILQDSDRDGILNPYDNCIRVANPLQEDLDNNGVGDVCVGIDTDNDGYLDLADADPNNPAIH